MALLKAKVERAYHEGREQAADDAHDDLTAAEWRMRQAERGQANEWMVCNEAWRVAAPVTQGKTGAHRDLGLAGG